MSTVVGDRFAPAWVAVACAAACGGDADRLADAAAADAQPEGRDRLSGLGLYADISSGVIADGVIEFQPAHVLWSDGSAKTRWVRIPDGGTIETSDMDRWDFPVGTRFFKEFVRDGVRVETRMIERLGEGPMDYWMGAFVWDLDESDALFAEEGRMNANGTEHDVPSAETCWTCHIGEPSRILGFSAIQLSRQGAGPSLSSIAEESWLSDPPPQGISYPAPGDEVESAALGYLHGNCGHCHNPGGTAWPDTSMDLRLRVSDRAVEETTIYTTTVDVALERWMGESFEARIVPGMPQSSGVIGRMATRGNRDEMPPIASELVDQSGISVVSKWIEALP